jgi:hypothetical protein
MSLNTVFHMVKLLRKFVFVVLATSLLEPHILLLSVPAAQLGPALLSIIWEMFSTLMIWNPWLPLWGFMLLFWWSTFSNSS